ncbi:MAG TPA: multiheme c-type cytochrome [Terriglobales bacterium]|nr:multiheme c-type cytochrome [Terriglobales bacterium]
MSFSQFRPRMEMSGEQFVGPQVCGTCHVRMGRSHTAMEHALLVPSDSAVLTSHSKMVFSSGKYSYEISSAGEQSLLRVTNGRDTLSEPIAYAFGNGYVAQTYVLRHNGKLYEGRVSYYSGIDGLDWTIGDAQASSRNLEEALGRDIDSDEARNCFSCHATAAVAGGILDLDHLVPGVTCEACHGPGSRHVNAMRTGSGEGTYIFNPKALDPETLSQQFCGACHRSADTVGMMPDLGGINNVRFQPYRMAASRGHSATDPHFACTACHDPHVDLKQEAAAYDANCTNCHRVQSATSMAQHVSSNNERSSIRTVQKSCPISKDRCVSCHMPKVELPGAHFKFTDHRIRIARAGDKYPI